MNTIASERQKLSQDALVTLCTLDASPIGGGVYHFTNPRNGTLVYGGKMYVPLDFEAEGFEIRQDGEPSVPTLRVKQLADTGAFMTALVRQYDDGRGAIFTRKRTYAMFLDHGADPNPNQHFPIELYYIERKKIDDGEILEWELSSILDQEGLKFPIRQIVRAYCDYTYRFWNGISFTPGECPYAGNNWFNARGVRVFDPALDVCGKRLTDCKLRFGQNAQLPYRGFPGLGRVR